MRNTIYEEQLLSFSYRETYGCFANSSGELAFTFTEGQEYTVVWDGVEFVRSAFAYTYTDGANCVAVGNPLVAGENSNGDNFAIVCDTSNGYLHFMSLENINSHTVAIYVGAEKTEYDIILKDRDGNNVSYNGVEAIKLVTADGGSVTFSNSSTGDGGGDSGVSLTKPIRFYDPYGEVIYSYTRAEIQKLTELPEGPPLGNLTFNCWTHTLEQLQSEQFFADVGPSYSNEQGSVTVLIVKTPKANRTVNLYPACSSNCTVDWGDGTTTSGKNSMSHSYSSMGEWIITIYNSASYTLGGYSSPYTNSGFGGGQISSSSTSYTYISNVALCELISVLASTNCKVYSLNNSLGLKFVSQPYYTWSDSYPAYHGCVSLKVIAGRVRYYADKNQNFTMCASLERVMISNRFDTNSTSTYSFFGNSSLKEVYFTGSTIYNVSMNSLWSLILTATTPPTISTTKGTPQWGTHPIYVPDEALETYKTADGWSTVAEYIFPHSQYPDSK